MPDDRNEQARRRADVLRDAADVLGEIAGESWVNVPDCTHYQVMAAGLNRLAGKLEDREAERLNGTRRPHLRAYEDRPGQAAGA
jgi:hypothetical protein